MKTVIFFASLKAVQGSKNMHTLVLILGFLFILKGTLYTFFPELMRRLITKFLALPENRIRLLGVVVIALGFFILSLARGH